MVAPIRFAAKRCNSGWTVRSFLATMYQLGFDFQAVPSSFWLNRSRTGAGWVAKTTFSVRIATAVTTSQGACRAAWATDSRSRHPVGVRALTKLGFAAALQARQRGLKGGDGVEEPVGGRQRDLVDEILRGGEGTPVEGGDPA